VSEADGSGRHASFGVKWHVDGTSGENLLLARAPTLFPINNNGASAT
jgi:hypothetical protein